MNAKHFHYRLLFFVSLLILGIIVIFFAYSSASPAPIPSSVLPSAPRAAINAIEPDRDSPKPKTPSVRIGATEIPVEIAKTSAEVQKGLSGRARLEPERGMLFLFSRADKYRFWMPDMHFPIDIIWISNSRVMDTDEEVSNEFDPVHPRFYTPAVPVRYVLEVNAGFAKLHGIARGDNVTFNYVE